MKRLVAFCVTLILSVSSLLFVVAPKALAATVTWSGGGSDTNMTTGANWVGGVPPVAGDDLIFPANVTNRDANNDFTAATSFNSVTFSGTATSDSGYVLTGNSMDVVAGISSVMTGTGASHQTLNLPITMSAPQSISTTSALNSSTSLTLSGSLNIGANAISVDAGQYISLDGVISGSGTITKSSNAILFISGDNSAYSGNIVITQGEIWAEHVNALGNATGSTTVQNGSILTFNLSGMGTNPTIAEPLILAGNGGGQGFTEYAVSTFKCASNGCVENVPLTLSGPVTLTADTKVAPGYQMKLTGSLSGNFTIGVGQGNAGKLVVQSSPDTSQTNNGTYDAPKVTLTYSDDQSSIPVAINYNETVIVNGKRQSISVNEGGTLKGTGTVGSVVVNANARIAPGLSPGCLNTGDLTFVSGSTYDFEVGGPTACSEYDQIKVTGTVNLGNGTLNTILYNGFKPVAGQSYTIISNDGSDAVIGTFNNLAEGATFTVNGSVLKITYKGGDGNDVVLTVQSVPTTPNTGFSLVSTYPLQSFITVTSLAGAIALIAKRYARVGIVSKK